MKDMYQELYGFFLYWGGQHYKRGDKHYNQYPNQRPYQVVRGDLLWWDLLINYGIKQEIQ